MKILAIESASMVASCAISEDDVILGEFSLNHKKTHSEKLMPAIEMLLQELNLKASNLDLICISEGPGSYTGIRIGAAIAKSIAYAVDIPIANIPTMKSLAANIYDTKSLIVPITDAKDKRVYSGIYKWESGKLIDIKEQFPTDIDELIDIVNEYKQPTIFNGDGSENYKDIIIAKANIDFNIAPSIYNLLSASKLIILGNEMAKEKKLIKASEFTPKYLRLSQAERNKT